jgi:tetratricopeptide (TPR) repeat protein
LLEALRLKAPDVLIPSDFVEEHGVPLKSFSRSLDMSFGLLPPTTRHVFMVLSLWKGAFSYDILETLTLTDSPTLRKDFYNLIDANLIDQVEGGAVGQFRFMPMVNQYAERKYAEYLSSCREEYSREMHNKCLLLNDWGKKHDQGWTSGAATIDIPNLDIFAANAYDSIVRAHAAKQYDDMMLVWEMFWRILELFIDPHELSKLGGYAFDYAAEIGNLPACAWTAVNSLGYSFLITGDFESALHGLKKGIEIGEQCKDYEAVAAGLRHLGRVSIYNQDYAAAEDLYLKSLDSAKSARPNERLRHEAASFSGLARVYLEQEKLDLAEDYSNQAITILRKINDLSRLSAALLGLGTCYLIRSKTDHHYIEKAKIALQESASFRRREITGQALMGLAEAEWMSGNKAKAIEFIHKAIEVLESVQAVELAKAKDLRDSFTGQYYEVSKQ